LRLFVGVFVTGSVLVLLSSPHYGPASQGRRLAAGVGGWDLSTPTGRLHRKVRPVRGNDRTPPDPNPRLRLKIRARRRPRLAGIPPGGVPPPVDELKHRTGGSRLERSDAAGNRPLIHRRYVIGLLLRLCITSRGGGDLFVILYFALSRPLPGTTGVFHALRNLPVPPADPRRLGPGLSAAALRFSTSALCIYILHKVAGVVPDGTDPGRISLGAPHADRFPSGATNQIQPLAQAFNLLDRNAPPRRQRWLATMKDGRGMPPGRGDCRAAMEEALRSSRKTCRDITEKKRGGGLCPPPRSMKPLWAGPLPGRNGYFLTGAAAGAGAGAAAAGFVSVLRLGLRLGLVSVFVVVFFASCLHGRSGSIGILHGYLVADLEAASLTFSPASGPRSPSCLTAGCPPPRRSIHRAVTVNSLRLGTPSSPLQGPSPPPGRAAAGAIAGAAAGAAAFLRRDAKARDRDTNATAITTRRPSSFRFPPRSIGRLGQNHSRTVPTGSTDTTHWIHSDYQ